MKFSFAIWLRCLLTTPVLGGGLVGYGIYPYNPYCGFTCDRSLSLLMLDCSTDMGMGSGMSMSNSVMTSAVCRAIDTNWLTTLAWCMYTKCAEYDVATSDLEPFWEQQCTGDPTVAPKWGCSVTLTKITSPPTQELNSTATDLNFTALVNEDTYLSQWNALTLVQRENGVEGAYGIALFVTGFGIPIILTWLGYVPYVSGLLDKIKLYIVYPSIIGTYQIRPLPYRLGNAPTIGQGLYIAMFFILNLTLTAVNYRSKIAMAWYATMQKEVTAYIFYRTEVFAFVLLPLLLLFSSRNNILLWMTNWSHSTYLLLHRWVARIFTLQVLLHSLLALPLYYPGYAYEFFLISHIVLSVFIIVGCWYHVYYWIGLTWGYETWLYAACAVWFFDRLARVGRILKKGVRRSKVTDLGGGYVRIDVAGIRWGSEPGKHVYAYFPTLTPLRPWENHPFSILPTVSLHSSFHNPSLENISPAEGSDQIDVKKHDGITERTKSKKTSLGSRPTLRPAITGRRRHRNY
ncbi:hypothetical protein G7Y89_g13456 [Cudoniella acicularis]|uniref:Ferric oxidoreductase domain-containing protein n=1 Tax=Cudoniella acicularis TaxID=354080 RepID=A0A8H4R9K8_9HELO|nr:hypothetical protein G7Y89_g13456 [Cudoniella acicularis]